LSPCSKKFFKEWNFQISPSNLEESFATNNLGPLKFHKFNNNPLQDFFRFPSHPWDWSSYDVVICMTPLVVCFIIMPLALAYEKTIFFYRIIMTTTPTKLRSRCHNENM
jgi:hypothetical protein